MITRLAGLNYEAFDKASKETLTGMFDLEENLVKLDEKLPNPTVAEILGVIVGVTYGLSIDELTKTLCNQDDVKKELDKMFEKMAKYMEDNFEFTIFDKV